MGALCAILCAVGLALPGEAGANSVASIVVAPDGRVYFSDYILADSRGNLFVADRKTRGVIRIAPGGRTSLYARLGPLTTPIGLGIAGENLLVVTQPRLPLPTGLTRISVSRISPGGTLTLLARTTRSNPS